MLLKKFIILVFLILHALLKSYSIKFLNHIKLEYIKMELKSKPLAFSLISLFIGMIILVVYYLQYKYPLGVLYNADILAYPLMVKSVISGATPYHSWYPTTRLGLFPDAVIVFISFLLSPHSLFFENLLAVIITTFLFYLALVYFYKTFLGHNIAYILSSATSLLIILLGTYTHFFFPLTYGWHFGAFILLLFSVSIIYRELTSNLPRSLKRLLVLCFISILCISSDSLMIYWFSAPMLLTLLLFYIVRKGSRVRCIYLSISVLLGVLLSFPFQKLVQSAPITQHQGIHISLIPRNIAIIHRLVLSNKLLLFVLIYAFLCLLFIFFSLLFKRSWLEDRNLTKHIFISFFSSTLTVTLLLGSLVVGPVTPVVRYFISSLLLVPISIVIHLALASSMKKLFNKFCHFATISLVAIMLTSVFFPWKNLNFNYTQKQYSCVYSTIKSSHLNNGIAGYWDATPLMIYAKEAGNYNLNIATYENGLKPYRWATSGSWFKKSYSFAVLNLANGAGSFSKKELFSHVGLPTRTVRCNNYLIFVYDKNKLVVPA